MTIRARPLPADYDSTRFSKFLRDVIPGERAGKYRSSPRRAFEIHQERGMIPDGPRFLIGVKHENASANKTRGGQL